MILSLLMGIIKNSQSTQSNKFAISLQYLKKGVKDRVNFLHGNKHRILSQHCLFNGSCQTWLVGNNLAIY